jgi:hypothetical protein
MARMHRKNNDYNNNTSVSEKENKKLKDWLLKERNLSETEIDNIIPSKMYYKDGKTILYDLSEEKPNPEFPTDNDDKKVYNNKENDNNNNKNNDKIENIDNKVEIEDQEEEMYEDFLIDNVINNTYYYNKLIQLINYIILVFSR